MFNVHISSSGSAMEKLMWLSSHGVNRIVKSGCVVFILCQNKKNTSDMITYPFNLAVSHLSITREGTLSIIDAENEIRSLCLFVYDTGFHWSISGSQRRNQSQRHPETLRLCNPARAYRLPASAATDARLSTAVCASTATAPVHQPPAGSTPGTSAAPCAAEGHAEARAVNHARAWINVMIVTIK